MHHGQSPANPILPAIAKNELKSTLDDTFNAHESVFDARYGAIASTSAACGEDRAAIIAINDREKNEDTKEFFRKYHQAIKHYYSRIWSTTGSREFIADYLEAEVLGHGRSRGDHNVVQKALE